MGRIVIMVNCQRHFIRTSCMIFFVLVRGRGGNLWKQSMCRQTESCAKCTHVLSSWPIQHPYLQEKHLLDVRLGLNGLKS